MRERLISMKEACFKTSLSRASIWRYIKRGKFPEPIPLGTRGVNSKGRATGRIAFQESKVDAFIAERIKTHIP